MALTSPDKLTRALDAGRLGGVYFLFGEEEFLKEEAAAAITAAHLDPATRDFNYDQLRGADDGKVYISYRDTALLAYRTAYLKAHYPYEFYAAAMNLAIPAGDPNAEVVSETTGNPQLEAMAGLNIQLQIATKGDWRSSFVLVGAPKGQHPPETLRHVDRPDRQRWKRS